MSFHVPEKYRLEPAGMPRGDEHNGYFVVQLNHGQKFMVIASNGMGWEHVSVSRKDRCPTWAEMCQIKDLFWDDADCVVQYHPPHSEYVNNHPYCLHMWRPTGVALPIPDSIMVGYKDVGVIV